MDMEQIKMVACKVTDLKKTLLDGACAEVGRGLDKVDTKELGDVVDMIKDLAQTEASCMEAKYYESVIEAMEEGSEERYGYNNRRYSSGRYAPKGSGHMGYSPTISQMPYVDAYLNDPEFEEVMYNKHYNSRMGYTDPEMMRIEGTDAKFSYNPRYGRSYNEYTNSRKHYTETHSIRDKEEMERHAYEHVADMVATLRDMYKASDPEMKKRIKDDLMKLSDEMKL